MLDFLFLYEHKVRELENISLIRAELEKRGYSVEFLKIRDFKNPKLFLQNKPKVVVTSCLYNDLQLEYHVYGSAGKVKKVVNLQWEQVLSKKWEKVGYHNPKENAKDATHICWGEAAAQRLNSVGVKNTVITGPVHMDFLRDELRDYYKTKEQLITEFNLKPDQKIVLYISSFTLASMSKEEIEYIEKRVSSDIGDFREAMIVSKDKTLQWIDKLLTEKKDITFIYRPHPNESGDMLIQSMQEKHENFKVIKDYSVKQWILAADKIFTWISTSLAEAFFAKKYCGILRPVELDEEMDMVLYKDAEFLTSYDEMLQVIENETPEFPVATEVITNHYQFDPAYPSYIKIADLLEKVYKTETYDMPENNVPKGIVKNLTRATVHQIIKKSNLLERYQSVPIKKVSSHLKAMKVERDKNGHEIASQKEIDTVLSNIRKVIK